jgi:hypothetical protein
MFLAAIAAGVITWLLVGSTLGVIVLHKNEAGIFPGLIAGIWAAWPLLHQGRVERYNFLHPAPKRYKVPLKIAFKKVRDLLGETTYNFGDRWKVEPPDTQEKRIHAVLNFSDESMKMDMDARGGVHTRTERERRTLIMDIQMKDEGENTVIQFDFVPKIEGSSYFACDSIVAGLLANTEAAIGAGTPAGKSLRGSLPAPPWWLLGLTAYGLLLLWGDVMGAVFHP